MNDIKRIADLMYQSVVQNNPGILKAGLVVIATEQEKMVKTDVRHIPISAVIGPNPVYENMEGIVKAAGSYLHYLDNVWVVVNFEGQVQAVLLHAQHYFPQHAGYLMPIGVPADQGMNPGVRVEIVGFSNPSAASEETFSLYESLCRVCDPWPSTTPTGNRVGSSAALNINGDVCLKADRGYHNSHQGGW